MKNLAYRCSQNYFPAYLETASFDCFYAHPNYNINY
jgi:hypothetical protein